MKRRNIAILVVALGVLAFLWENWHSASRPKQSDAVQGAEPLIASRQGPAATSTSLTREGKVRAVLDRYNQKEIEFYGKVVDQYDSPIVAVEVTASVIYNSAEKSGVQEAHTTTNADGGFSFTGMKGRTFDYHLEKAGYQTMPEGDAFDYTHLVPEEKRHHPDPRNPVVLKMWKLQGPEPLIHFERKYFPLPADGTLVQIDLGTGEQVLAGGDLVFSLNHIVLPPGALPSAQFDWNARIGVVGGGVVESSQRLMYLAPDSGYVPEVTVDMPATKPDWANSINRNYYVQTRGNLFGRLEVYLNVNQRGYDPSFVMLQWWLNPRAGSRNLEVATEQLAPTSGALRN